MRERTEELAWARGSNLVFFELDKETFTCLGLNYLCNCDINAVYDLSENCLSISSCLITSFWVVFESLREIDLEKEVLNDDWNALQKFSDFLK